MRTEEHQKPIERETRGASDDLQILFSGSFATLSRSLRPDISPAEC
jgi:hypothetical protein